MLVLVTGPWGTVGYEVVRELLHAGHAVRCFDLDNKVNRKTAKEFSGRVECQWGDITNAANVKDAALDVDAVIHLAAIIPPGSEINPKLAHKVNVGGTQNIIAAIHDCEKKPLLVFTSSIAVLGNRQDAPPPRHVDEPYHAEDEYAKHKIECEQLVRASSIHWVILRIGACLDLRTQKGGDDQKAALKRMFDVSPDVRIEYIHPADVAKAMTHAVSTPAVTGKVLFLGGGKSCQISWLQMSSLMLVALGIKPLPREAFGTNSYYTDWMDTEESQRLLQYQTISFPDFQHQANLHLRLVSRFLIPFRRLIRYYILKQSPYLNAKN